MGQIAPRPCGAGHVRLTAEFSFHSHFARHCRNLSGKRSECVDHVIDRLSELGNFAFGLKEEFTVQVALCDCRNHFGNATHLIGQVGRHEIDVVGEIFPSS